LQRYTSPSLPDVVGQQIAPKKRKTFFISALQAGVVHSLSQITMPGYTPKKPVQSWRVSKPAIVIVAVSIVAVVYLSVFYLPKMMLLPALLVPVLGPGIIMTLIPSSRLSHTEVIQLFNNVSLLLGLEEEHEQSADVLRCPSMKNAAARRQAQDDKAD
jgi:hypothetical protein